MGLGGYNPRTVNGREVRIERTGGEVTLSIDVPAEEIRKKEQDFLARAQAQLKVPGFRRGRAPHHLVLRHYGEDEFVQDVKDDLVREWVGRALRELDLHPLTTPTVETTAFVPGERLAFQVKFAVFPDVTVPDQLSLELAEPEPAVVTDEDLTAALADLRREAAVLEPKEGPAEEGDVVRLQRGDHDWEGEATAARPIGKQLLGVRAGERITLTDADGGSQGFVVTGVYRLLLPSPDETAAHYGHPSWEALTEAVRTELAKAAEARRLRAWRLAALDALAESLQVEVPPTLLAEAVASEMKELRLSSGQRSQLEEALRRKLRREIVAQAVAAAKGLRPDENEVRQRAAEQGRDEETVRAVLTVEQAADWVITNARRNG